MKRIVWIIGAAAATLAALFAQQTDFSGVIKGNGALPSLAVPDLRGDGQSQAFMSAFNETLWSDLKSAGVVNLVPKSQYPLGVPQQLSDFERPRRPRTRRAADRPRRLVAA